jgi:serine/threonine protein kinase
MFQQEGVIISDFSPIGCGAFAKVYQGLFQNKKCAVKVIDMERFQGHDKQKRILNEIEICKKMNHPNIIGTFHVIITPKTIYMAMEFADTDFSAFLTREKSITEKRAIVLFTQLAEGLKYLRNCNVFHRDLKPKNILMVLGPVDGAYVMKIGDFGFAKVLRSEQSLNDTICGTPMYMAPEIMLGDSYTDKADLWSVGAILYESLCGNTFLGQVKTIHAVREIHMQKDVDICIPHVSRAGISLLTGLLRKKPDMRMEWEEFFGHVWFKPPPFESIFSLTLPSSPGIIRKIIYNGNDDVANTVLDLADSCRRTRPLLSLQIYVKILQMPIMKGTILWHNVIQKAKSIQEEECGEVEDYFHFIYDYALQTGREAAVMEIEKDYISSEQLYQRGTELLRFLLIYAIPKDTVVLSSFKEKFQERQRECRHKRDGSSQLVFPVSI